MRGDFRGPALFLLLGVLLGASIACGPRNPPETLLTTQSIPTRPNSPAPVADPNAERIASLDREIAILEGAIQDEDPYVESDLEARIARGQETIAALSLEADLERATQSDAFRILQARQADERDRFRTRLAAMADQVRAEERALADERGRFASVTAPEESDLIRQGRAALAGVEARASATRSEYEALLAEYNAAPEGYFSDQSRQLETNRARLTELATLIADAQTDLHQAMTARDQMMAERNSRQARLRELRAAREQIQSTPTAGATVAE